MINEGGKRVFFFVWVFLHLAVAALGTVHYCNVQAWIEIRGWTFVQGAGVRSFSQVRSAVLIESRSRASKIDVLSQAVHKVQR